MTTLITIVSIIALILAILALVLILKYTVHISSVERFTHSLESIDHICIELKKELSRLDNNIEHLKQSLGAKLGDFKKRMAYVECEEHNIIVAKINIIAAPNAIEKPTESVHMSCNTCGKEWFKDIYHLNEPERRAYFAFRKSAPTVNN